MAKQTESLADRLARETLEKRANKKPKFIRTLPKEHMQEIMDVLDAKLRGVIGHSRKVLAEIIATRFGVNCTENILQSVIEWRKRQTGESNDSGR